MSNPHEDRIYIHHLTVDTVIGVRPWEREVRQTLILDLELGIDAARAGANDALEETLDYAEVARLVTEFVEQSEFQLLERLAQAVAELLHERLAPPWVRIRIAKPGAIANAQEAGVVIERRAGDFPG
ncbi:MAG: dihydroneopterin aldolase [Pseudomonadales bacterium]